MPPSENEIQQMLRHTYVWLALAIESASKGVGITCAEVESVFLTPVDKQSAAWEQEAVLPSKTQQVRFACRTSHPTQAAKGCIQAKFGWAAHQALFGKPAFQNFVRHLWVTEVAPPCGTICVGSLRTRAKNEPPNYSYQGGSPQGHAGMRWGTKHFACCWRSQPRRHFSGMIRQFSEVHQSHRPRHAARRPSKNDCQGKETPARTPPATAFCFSQRTHFHAQSDVGDA